MDRPLRPFPPFNKPEEYKINQEALSPLGLIKGSLICFYTRCSFEEGVLGVGVKIKSNHSFFFFC